MSDKIYYVNDRVKVDDEWKISDPIVPKTKVLIINDETGEPIWEGHNRTVISGAAFIAMKLFSLSMQSLDATPTYDATLKLDHYNANGEYPVTEITNPTTGNVIGSYHDETQRKICGFCIGQGGAGLDISDRFDVPYASWINPDDLVPFRYPLNSEDRVDESIYKGRFSNIPIVGTDDYRNAYYFKTFSNTPVLVQNYTTNTGKYYDNVSSSTVYDEEHSNLKAQSFVELHLKITKDDAREFFNAHKGIESAKINQLSLLTAWTKTVKPALKADQTDDAKVKEVEYMMDVRPFSIVNIPNEVLSDLSKSISVIYTLYF